MKHTVRWHGAPNDRSPPQNAGQISDNLPLMQTHVLCDLEVGPVVQTQTLRDFEKVSLTLGPNLS
uniref:Uncharacterized protein n=1 Tax=Chelonoidis abingdonii TaxID=106734 RepID=A0A8C0IRC9_CHEAB